MSFTSNCGHFSSMTSAQVSSMSSPMSVSRMTGSFFTLAAGDDGAASAAQAIVAPKATRKNAIADSSRAKVRLWSGMIGLLCG